MSMRKTLSIGLVASLAVSAVPTWAEPASPATTGPVQASLDRATTTVAVRATAAPLLGRPATRVRATTAQQMSGGGGGGGGRILLVLLGAAVSVGTAYYLMREIRKQAEDLVPTP